MIKQIPKDFVPKFFNETANSYDKIVYFTTFGKDNVWKQEILEQLSNEKTVLDLACGTGILTKKIVKKIPSVKIVGIDITLKYLQKAKEKLIKYENISFINQDAEKIKLEEKFDCITASYLPKYCTSKILIKNCIDHLNPDGKIILQDFTYPTNPLVRKLWNIYFKVLYFTGFFIPSWKQIFIDLPQMIRDTNWVKEYEDSMKEYGLKIFKKESTWSTSTIIVGTKIP